MLIAVSSQALSGVCKLCMYQLQSISAPGLLLSCSFSTPVPLLLLLYSCSAPACLLLPCSCTAPVLLLLLHLLLPCPAPAHVLPGPVLPCSCSSLAPTLLLLLICPPSSSLPTPYNFCMVTSLLFLCCSLFVSMTVTVVSHMSLRSSVHALMR